MDFITNLPLFLEYDSILVIVNHGLTKMALFIPCHKTVTAEETSELLYQNIY